MAKKRNFELLRCTFMGVKGERIWEQAPRKLITKGKTPYGVCLWGVKVKGYGSHLKLQENKDFYGSRDDPSCLKGESLWG